MFGESGSTQAAANDGATRASVALTASSTSSKSVEALIDSAFNKNNAQLVKDYYQEALTSIENSTTTDEVQQAVAVFKAKVGMVQIMQTNDDELTNIYVILLICIAIAVAALIVSFALWKVKSVKLSDDDDDNK
jgi:hypothetical protein